MRSSHSLDRHDVAAAAMVALVLAIVAYVVLPVLTLERAEDWRAYSEASGALKSGGLLYIWTTYPDIRSFGQHAYLYPPPLAAIWSVGVSPEVFAVAKAAILAGALWFLARRLGAPPVVAVGVVLAALVSPPTFHDLVLGNVMTLFAAAVALSLADEGRLGSGALGFVCAVALKPAIGPYVVWLLIRRRRAFGGAFAVGVVTTIVFALILGPGRYIEYLQALPRTTALAAPFTGNLGLAAVSPLAAVVGLIVAYAWTLAAAARFELRCSAVVALAMTQLAQPTIGLNYAVLLVPALVILWAVHPRAGLAMAVSLPLIVLVSPIVASLLLAATATVVALRTTRLPARSMPLAAS
jgi:hypothetical protein